MHLSPLIVSLYGGANISITNKYPLAYCFWIRNQNSFLTAEIERRYKRLLHFVLIVFERFDGLEAPLILILLGLTNRLILNVGFISGKGIGLSYSGV